MNNLTHLTLQPISSRVSQVHLSDLKVKIARKKQDNAISQPSENYIEVIQDIIQAKDIFFFIGGHVIKNGGGLLLIELINRLKDKRIFVSTNGACMVHDAELAKFGYTSESVAEYLPNGQFGCWTETLKFISDCVDFSLDDSGLGEAIYLGLYHTSRNQNYSASLFSLNEGKNYKVLVHPALGQDIYFLYPKLDWGKLAQLAQQDFNYLVHGIKESESNSVVITLGSGIMAPQVFEKTLSAAINLKKGHIKFKKIYVVDIQETAWDWSKGEPPKDSPEYYHRFMKSFIRSKSPVSYFQEDHFDFLSVLTNYFTA